MKNNANGISPILALVLTVLVAFFTVRLFTGGHIFWGIVFAVICVDFCADLVLSLRKQ
ncbi:MAG: hypothetical protein IJ237_09820 [Oscillospiraceae bacterium]|nr:hypothetical protein [Oscillospiraceae bacterium]